MFRLNEKVVRPRLETGMADRLRKTIDFQKISISFKRHIQHNINASHNITSLSKINLIESKQLRISFKQNEDNEKKSVIIVIIIT